MTPDEKKAHRDKAADFYQAIKESSDDGAIQRGLAMVIMRGRTSRYDLLPHEDAVCFLLLHRADPSFTWPDD